MQFEPALEIVGALKRRFGEPMTVTDLCRELPLSYQPIYEYVHRLEAAGAVALRKAGQRLLCEPAATVAGSLWLAQWSVCELRRIEDAAVAELARVVESRIRERAVPPTAIVALDPHDGRRLEVRGTVAGLLPETTVQVLSLGQLAEWLHGPEGSWEVARRMIPLAGHQPLWALALAARERAEGRTDARPTARRRSIFGD